MSSVRRFSEALLAIALIGGTVWLVVRPNGIWENWREGAVATAQQQAVIAQRWSEITATTAVLGSGESAKVVMFVDYHCPFCRRNHEIIETALADHPGESIGIRFFPLGHPRSFEAATAAVCASRVGVFAAFHSRLYEAESLTEVPDWVTVARESGVEDIGGFQACLASAEAAAAVDGDIRLARELGVSGTPTWVTRDGVEVGFRDAPAVASLLSRN